MVAEIPSYYFWLIFILPYAGCLITTLMGRLGKARDYAAVLFSLASAVFSFLVFLPTLESQSFTVTNSVIPINVPWIPGLAGRYSLNMGVLVDPYTIILTNIVSWIGFLIMVYSLDYMKGMEGLTRYWFFMNFFLGSMQLIVLSNNLLSLFIGWEGVGLASYALIGFHYKDQKEYWVGTPGHTALGEEQAYSPSHAGMKAFVMTRAGDVAFLAGLFILFFYSGTFSFQSLASNTTWVTNLSNVGLVIPVALLIFGGAVGKSAQFPLQEWLPDAMAGPAPVSALIHAATMVNAGVILVARIGPIFYFGLVTHPALIQPFFITVAWIGAFTAFLAATQGMVGYELKKILAYSTASQIGYMIMALGLAGLSISSNFAQGLSAALFHLTSQAIFKACLFMIAGVLIHITGTKYINEMGEGLKDKMKLTFAMFLIAAAALSGIPPLSGFWSKDAVLATAWDSGQFGLYLVGAVTAGITAFYAFRMVGIIFYGRGGKNGKHPEALEEAGMISTTPHEMGPEEEEQQQHQHTGGTVESHAGHKISPLSWVPFTILGVMCIVIGVATPVLNLGGVLEAAATNYLNGLFPTVVSSTVPNVPFNWEVSGITIIFVAVGVFSAWYLYIGRRMPVEKVIPSTGFLHAIHTFLWNRWYINAIYYKVFVNAPIEFGQWTLDNVEDRVLSRINNLGVSADLGLSVAGNWLDRIVDAIAGGFALVGQWLSSRARRMQTGILEQYALIFTIGLIIMLILFVLELGVKLP